MPRPLRPGTSRPHPPSGGEATGWRQSASTAAVGAVVTVLVTGILGATATWLFRDDDNAEGGESQEKVPFTWVVTHAPADCPYYVVDGSRDDIPKLPSNAEKLARWTSQVDAIPAHPVALRLTLQGTSDTVVVLDSLAAKVVGTPDVDGDLYSVGVCPIPELAPVRIFEGELNPTASTIPLSASRASDFPYRISLTEPEVFRILVDPGRCTCDWTLQVGWTSGGESGTVTIDDEGEPFRSASRQGRVQYMYDSPAKRWVENPFS